MNRHSTLFAAAGAFGGMLAASALAQPTATALHPLDSLSRTEIMAAWSVLRSEGKATRGARLVTMRLQEPPKAEVLRWQPGQAVQRHARAVLYDWDTNVTSEAVIDVTGRKLAAWTPIPNAQPPILAEDHTTTERITRAHPAWQAAIKKRGLDANQLRVMGYPPGGYVQPADRSTGSRLALGVAMFAAPEPYGGTVQGLYALVDLTRGRVIRLVDSGEPARQLRESPIFDGRIPGPIRLPVKPLRPVQPEGVSYTVDGSEVRWEKWRFRFGMDPRVGLQLHTVGYEDRGRVRPILYRAQLSEMVVPYGDAGWTHLNPFDAGENGMWRYGATSLNRLDAPENARFFSAPQAYADGSVRDFPRAVALYERDGGVLWRHEAHTRRARQLVLMSFSTIDNYDYAFRWIFHQDGTLESEVLLTGQMNVKTVARFKDEAHGTQAPAMAGHLVGPQMEAPNHQHFFNFRLDMDVDGEMPNTVVEVDTEPLPEGPENPDGNGWVMRETPLRRETEARRNLNLATHRRWKVINGASRNPWGQPAGYTLVAGENGVPMARPGSFLRKHAGFVDHHLWVTPYAAGEEYAAGDFVNAGFPGQGLPAWTSANRAIENTDLVLWYTLGVTHLPRPEDWPVMPVHRAGFKLVPTGFFARNPALDVPAAP